MLKKFLANEKNLQIIRYIVVGGMTTFISFSSYWIMYKLLEMEPNLANVISIIIAIIFAYIANKLFVFRKKLSSFKLLIVEFFKFLSSRAVTMLLEIVGVYIALEVFNLNELLSKAIVSVIVVILNYILARFFVFDNRTKSSKKEMFR